MYRRSVVCFRYIIVSTLHKGDDDDNDNDTDNNKEHVSDIPGNHDVKGTTENSRIGHCTRTSESANVKTQKSRRRN
jgi:hypothetical protein